MGINGDFFGNLGRMQTGLKKPRLYIHHLFGLMQFTVQYCFHVICTGVSAKPATADTDVYRESSVFDCTRSKVI